MSTQALNKKTVTAYSDKFSVYSRLYPVLSLFAYWIVWRGHIFKHIRFFRGITDFSSDVLDVATGDGSLTKAALFSGASRDLKVTCVDISPDMLNRAREKLPPSRTTCLIGDVLKLPFENQSQRAISCFGGFNSFPEGPAPLKELARVLAPQGVLRGLILLYPRATWRRRLIQSWIRKGYQTQIIEESTFDSWVRQAGLSWSQKRIHGDVLLFELRKP